MQGYTRSTFAPLTLSVSEIAIRLLNCTGRTLYMPLGSNKSHSQTVMGLPDACLEEWVLKKEAENSTTVLGCD